MLILEGNTYSGKTRAAFHAMQHREEWKDFKFFIYDKRFTIEDLNRIRIDTTGISKFVIFIDDINDIVSSSPNVKFNRTQNTIWSLLQGLRDSKQEDLGENYIILTVSGKLSDDERANLYDFIFDTCGNNVSRSYEDNLDDVKVNFDIYDKFTFNELVRAMLRDNIISKKDIRSGNYTIGSLFIKIDDIKEQLKKLFKKISYNYLFKAIVGNYKIQYSGYKETIKNIYDFFCELNKDANAKNCFESNVEKLRSWGYITTKPNDGLLFIDRDIILILEELVFKDKYKEENLFADLLDYAKKNENENNNFLSIIKIGYLLCDRNSWDKTRIENLIILIIEKFLNIKIKFSNNGTCNKEQQLIKSIFPKYAVEVVKGVKDCNSTYYPFFETAIARIQDFDLANDFICEFKVFWDDKKTEGDYNIAIDLYKQMLYAMFSTNNRRLTISQEKKLLKHIFDEQVEFDEQEKWLEPFSKNDLNNILNLTRISPFLTKSLDEQVVLIAKAQIPTNIFEEYKQSDNDYLNKENNDDFDSEYAIDDDWSDSDDSAKDSSHFLKKRISIAIINLLCSLKKYEEFKSVVESITDVCNQPENNSFRETITENLFHKSFYYNVKNIVKSWTQEDCNCFFNFLFELENVNNIFGIPDIDDNANKEEMSRCRTLALNNLLKLLSSNDAIVGYHKMKDSKKDDYFTFSNLLNNEFIGFEELFIFFETDDTKKRNHITLNQLMKKAQTLSDASVCMMNLMGIKDANPSKLKDEFALGQYFAIKNLTGNSIIKIIKEWRTSPQNENRFFDDATLNVILNKFSIEWLVDIFQDKEDCDDLGKYYKDKYGLLYEKEIVPARENAQLLTIFFNKLNGSENDDIKTKLQQNFNSLIDNNDLKKLVCDPIYKNSILSVYLKNELLFPNYESVKDFLTKFETNNTILKTYGIYAPFLWHCVKDFNDNRLTHVEALNKMNAILVEAYTYFSEYYTREEVVFEMSKLYEYIPKLFDKEGFKEDGRFKFAYEEKILEEMSFGNYIKYFYGHNPSYINTPFVHYVLYIIGNTEFNESIYEQLGQISVRNNCRLNYKKNYPEAVQSRLLTFNTTNSTIIVDTRFIKEPLITLLCYMLNNGVITFQQAEDIRQREKVVITQTYLNLAFKKMEKNDNAYDDMINYKNNNVIKPLFTSIQMCLSLINVAPNMDKMNAIWYDNDFANLLFKTEIIGAFIHRLHCLPEVKAEVVIEEAKKIILNSREEVNIIVINEYLNMLFKVSMGYISWEKEENKNKYDIQGIFNTCWRRLEQDGKIDINVLLGNESDEEWIIESNVQTYSFFVKQCPTIISYIWTKFNGNFYYIEDKSCLENLVKNYNKVYKVHYNHLGHYSSLKEVRKIAKILSSQEQEQVFKSLCQYIVNGKNIVNGKSLSFFKALLCVDVFGQKFINYIDSNEKLLKIYKGNERLSNFIGKQKWYKK